VSGILLVVLVFFALAAGLGGVAYFTYKRKMRRAKAIERGLKMVPILIRLPPPSSDTASGSRDIREVMREKTAQAEVLYDLLGGTATEGFKSNFYGQRHVAFELIVIDGLVHFFAVAPVALVSIVKKSILTAYPGARLEEVEDHNIFNQEGRLAATLGGEMVLRAESAYPIATYEQLERDPMEALLTTVSALEKADGVAIQIMLRPAGTYWVKRSISLADGLRKGRSADLKFSAMDLAKAVVKAPEQRRDEERARSGGAGDASNLQLSQVERIEEKTKHTGFEVLIRVIVSTSSVARSQQLLRDISTAFALYEAPGLNGFKFLPALDVQGLVTAFIFRFFPPELKGNVLSSGELATLFHLPDSQFTPSMSVERQQSKQVDGPVQMPTVGLLFGYNEFRGVKKEIRLSPEDRRRHTYILGQTGTGKSTMLENLAVQDMLSGNGFAFIDPHGDSAEKLLAMVPKERAEDVIYFNPADAEYPLGLNLFEFTDPAQKDFIVQETINMLYKLYDPGHTGIIGPRYEHWYRNAALTLMSDPNGSTFIEIPKVFTDTDYLKQKFKYLKDPTVIDFWTKEMGQTSDYHKSEMLGWFVSKFGAFQNNEIMRNIIGQTKSAFNIRDVMDNRKILIVNLSKGRIGELNSQLLGMIFVIKFQAAAMSRADAPEDERADFALYVDEFQNFATDSFASILSEARKYRLNLIVANQFIGQLSNEIRDAVFGNIGTIVAHRMGPDDAEFMVKQFAPVFDASDLVNIPNFNAAMRLMIGGLPSQPFSVRNSAPLGNPNAELGMAIKQLSAAKFGHDKRVVEADILNRFSGRPAAAPAPAPSPSVAAAASTAVAPILTGAGVPAQQPSLSSAPLPVQTAPTAGAVPLTPAPAAPTSVSLGAAPPIPNGPISAVATGATLAPAAANVPTPSVLAAMPPTEVPVASPAALSIGPNEIAAQLVAAAQANPLQNASLSTQPRPDLAVAPPIGAPPISLPSSSSSAGAPVKSSGTLSLNDITGGQASTRPTPDDVPLLGSAPPAVVREEQPPAPMPEPKPEPMLSDGRPLAGDPYANIDIMGGSAPPTEPPQTPPSETESLPVLVPEPESSTDGTPLPDDPYGGIDILGETDDIAVAATAPSPVATPPEAAVTPASAPIPSPSPAPILVPSSAPTPIPDPPVPDSPVVEATQPAAPLIVVDPVSQPTAAVSVVAPPDEPPIAAMASVLPPAVIAPSDAIEPSSPVAVVAAPQPMATASSVAGPSVPAPVVAPAAVVPEPAPSAAPAAEPMMAAAVGPAFMPGGFVQAAVPVPVTPEEPVADWSNEPEPKAEPLSQDVPEEAAADPYIHFVDPAAQSILNGPDRVPEERTGASVLDELPPGVQIVGPPAQSVSQVAPVAVEPTPVAVTSAMVSPPIPEPVPEVPVAVVAPPLDAVPAPAPMPVSTAATTEQTADQLMAVGDTVQPLPPAEPATAIAATAADEAPQPVPVAADNLPEATVVPEPVTPIAEVAHVDVAEQPLVTQPEPIAESNRPVEVVPAIDVPAAPAAVTPSEAAVSTSTPVKPSDPVPTEPIVASVPEQPEVQPQPDAQSEPEPRPAPVSKPDPASEPEPELAPQPEPIQEPQPQPEPEANQPSEGTPAAKPTVESAQGRLRETPDPIEEPPTDSGSSLEPDNGKRQPKDMPPDSDSMTGAEYIKQAEHKIDDLLSVSLIHSESTPTHHRLPDQLIGAESDEDTTGIDLELNEQKPDAKEHDKQERIAIHHGLKVIQPLDPIVPPKERFAKELAEMSQTEDADDSEAVTNDTQSEEIAPAPSVPAPAPSIKTVADEPEVVAPTPVKPAAPAPASEPVEVPQPISAPAQDFYDMPQAQSLAADDVAKAREQQEAASSQATSAAQTPPLPEKNAATVDATKHEEPKHEESEPSPEQAGKGNKPDRQLFGSGRNRKRRRGGRDGQKRNESPESAPTAAPAAPPQNAPVEEKPRQPQQPAPVENAPLTGQLIMPSGKRPEPEPVKRENKKPKKLAAGEVYVDESGNVMIGE
jgi:hypothetical protein